MRLSRLLGIALLAFCAVSRVQAAADLKIHGSDTVGAELAPALIKEWLQQQGYGQIVEKRQNAEHLLTGMNKAGKSLSVELETRGSSTGFKSLQSEQADIGMSSRPIKASEVNALKRFGHCDTAACEYVLGLDGIAVIVSPKNPIAKLDTASLRRIFSGEIKDWSKVGGSAGPIHVYGLDDNSGTYDTFKSLVLGKAALAGSAKRDASHEAISKMVAGDPAAIGFVGLPFVHNSKPLAIADGEARPIKPAAFSVATEDYVLARRLFFYAPEVSAPPLARDFVEFAVSDAGQAIVKRVGFVSQEVVAGPEPLDENAPEEYRKLTADAQRLSLNFRFMPGTPKLDNKAQRDVERLKKYMAKPASKQQELMLFGFADSNESMPIVSLQLSTDRADVVADLLVKQGLRPGKVRGYGNAVPVASNDTEAGRAKNRRVEVWVR
jgi:phosphate transport system substrate-binding protein